VVRFAELLVGFYVLRNLVLLAAQGIQERIIQRSASRIAVRLLARYLYAPYPFHFHRSSASLMHQVRDSVDTVIENVLAAAVHIASELLVVLGLLALLAAAAPAETVMAVAAVLVLLVAPFGVTRRLYARWGEDERSTGERMIAHLQQSLDAVKAIVVGGRQEHFVARYAADRLALEGLKLRRALGSTALRLGVETVFICAMLLAVIMLAAAGRSGADAVSVLSLFAYAGFRVVPSANRVILNANLLRFGAPFVAALVADWSQLEAQPPEGAVSVAPLAHAIECRELSFSYQGTAAKAIDRVSFTIAAGTSVAIVGPTGAGKSTVVDLLLGLLAPSEGAVLVDGRDIATARDSWLRQVGYVPQEIVLIDDSLRRNIAFGVSDDRIDEGRIARAVAGARLESLVASLPGGLDAAMGERGIRLSGGERQRIAIARALYNEPAVLVFDEATSALDAQTERELGDAIDRIRGERTVIVIAHRMTTVRRCDQIFVLERGRLTAQGRYEELLDRSELFRALAGSS
jgi:ATP-binding cassette subfamily C protein